MTVEENLRLGAYTRPRSAELGLRSSALYETFPVLRESRRRAGRRSLRRPAADAGDGAGAAPQPRLILLDEPTLGLAPLVFTEIFRHRRERLRRSGQTILMVEQNAAKALEISDYAYVLELGQNR